ncbi:hypothetical protein P3W45_001174 [Vairimorpha bombi]|jgi:hypothetical protein
MPFPPCKRSRSLPDSAHNIPGIAHIEHIIESNIKYVQGEQDEYKALMKLKDLRMDYQFDVLNRSVCCKTSSNISQLRTYLKKLGDVENISNANSDYKIIFRNIFDADLCAISSTSEFRFTKANIFSEFNELREMCLSRKIPVQGIYNTEMPVDYNKLVIGPLNVSKEEIAVALDKISSLFGIRECESQGYFVFLFKDPKISKKVVDILSKVEISNNKDFKISFAYDNCLITNLPSFFRIPFASSFDPSRIIFLLNTDIPENEIIKICGKKDILEIKYSASKMIFIKCQDIEKSQYIHDILGGYMYNNKIIISGYFPEFNYEIGLH